MDLSVAQPTVHQLTSVLVMAIAQSLMCVSVNLATLGQTVVNSPVKL